MGEEKRHQMLQNLFGDQSEEEDDIDSEHESNPNPNYASDEAEGALEPEGEGEVEGDGAVEVESEGELRNVEPDPGESEGEREQSSQEVDVGDHREESEAKDTDSDEKEEYGQRVVTSRRREVIESGSERSEENNYPDNEDEVDQARNPSKSPGEERDQTHLSHSAAELRDVFGDSDDEEAAEYAVQNEIEQDENRSPMEENGSYEKDLQPEDIVPDEDVQYASEDENVEVKHKEKPLGPPLELEIPLRPPPADSTKMNMIKVSNIMGIDPKPFDPKTYVEEDRFLSEESASKKRIRLENNIVRRRIVKRPDGTKSYESNARFVRWSDGSLQLLIGNEVLDISVQDAQHDQAHLFLKHGKGILQSQGRILRKMKFMPSSLSSNSHRLLTALVDSQHKKVFKVKNCITDIDPEREKEQREKAASQTIRANVLLNRKREKVSRKYTQTSERRRQLSTGYLENLDEDDEMDYNDLRRSRHRFDEDLQVEARAEKRIMNAKKSQGYRDIPRKSSFTDVKSSRRPVNFSDSEREESEYETDGEEDERSPSRKRVEDEEPEYEEDEEEEEEEHEDEADANGASEEEAEEPKQRVKEFGGSMKRKGIESDEDSPPRKAPTHRRMAVVYDSDEE